MHPFYPVRAVGFATKSLQANSELAPPVWRRSSFSGRGKERRFAGAKRVVQHAWKGSDAGEAEQRQEKRMN